MGNREHDKMLERHPWLRRYVRGFHGDGPQPWIKRVWAKKLRRKFTALLRRDPDNTVYPIRAGNLHDWY